MLKRLENTNLSLHVGIDTVTPSNVVRDLGVLLDSELTMRQHISKTVGACFYHLRRLKVRWILGNQRNMQTRHCICYESPRLLQSTIVPLQRVQNAAVRLVSRLRPRDHITSALRELHWLPIRYRMIYKLCLTMHNAHVGRSLRYIIDTLSPIADKPNRGRLRLSASSKYELLALRLKIGERAFSYSEPAYWNSLPSELASIMDTQTFKSRLKTHIFRLAYDC